MRTLIRFVRDGWQLVRLVEEAHADLAIAHFHADRMRHHLACATELVEERDRQLATLAARCRRAEDERDLWRRFYEKSVPEMEA